MLRARLTRLALALVAIIGAVPFVIAPIYLQQTSCSTKLPNGRAVDVAGQAASEQRATDNTYNPLKDAQQQQTHHDKSGPAQRGHASWVPGWLCGELRLTDLALVYFTYCLVVVGWFTLRSNERTLHDIERAHVFLAMEIEHQWIPNALGGRNLKVLFAFKNHGKTLAVVTKINAEVRTVSALPGSIRNHAVEIPPGLTIGSGETTTDFQVINLVTEADLATLIGHERIVLFVGAIQYRDIFGKDHSTGFCLNWNPVLEVLSPSPTTKLNYYT